jgi:hypothetical protein
MIIQNSILDYYSIPKKLSNLGINVGWKRVVLVSKKPDGTDVNETDRIGRGNTIKVSSDPEAALKWLKDK